MLSDIRVFSRAGSISKCPRNFFLTPRAWNNDRDNQMSGCTRSIRNPVDRMLVLIIRRKKSVEYFRLPSLVSTAPARSISLTNRRSGNAFEERVDNIFLHYRTLHPGNIYPLNDLSIANASTIR